MNNYELMLILSPLLTEESCKTLMTKYKSFLKESGAEVEYDNFWGLRSFAYEIQKRNTGFYWVVEYKAKGDVNDKLKIQLLRDESVMRHLVTKLDKYAVEYNLRKRKTV